MDNKNEFKKKSCSIVKGKKQTKKYYKAIKPYMVLHKNSNRM